MKNLPLGMAWFWSASLVFFPAWLFGNTSCAGRLKSLILVLAWIVFNIILLKRWLAMDGSGRESHWQAAVPQRRQRILFAALSLPLLALNVVAATYRLTSSGDEAAHAGTFRGLGRNMAAILDAVAVRTSMPGWLLAAGALLLLALGLALLYRFCRRSARRAWLSLLLLALGLVPLVWFAVELLSTAGRLTPDELTGLVRFPPLSKFIWMPFTVLGWNSVFVLRLPALLCWLLSGWVLYRAALVRMRSSLALLPGLLLLCLPGYFYYGHLVYLTSPMILVWCGVLYLYSCYLESNERRYLVLTALLLNAGTLLRVETSYLTLALLAHMLLVQLLQKRELRFENLIDLGATGWLGVSFIPLWSFINPGHRPFFMVWRNLLNPRILFAIADDYPLHVGLPVFLFLLAAILGTLWRLRQRRNLSGLGLLCLLMMGVSYLLYTLDYIMIDYRMMGLLEYGREWQTANRFLVSWSPFVALLLTEGVERLPWKRLQAPLGALLVGLLLAQATFWAAPFTMPEFTSIRLRPGAEYPQLPEREVLQVVSHELAGPQTRILLSPHLGATYFLDEALYPGDWQPAYWAPYEEQTLTGLVQYCTQQHIDLVVLPLVWMNLPGTKIEVSQQVLQDSHFEVLRVFDYLGEPGILVARFVGAQ